MRGLSGGGVSGIQTFDGVMNRSSKLKVDNMKTRILLALGAVALTAATFNLTAADTLLSPRAAGNVIHHATGANDANTLKPDTTAALSPRAASGRIGTVASVPNDFNPALMCRKVMAASPKAITACEANPAMPCCTAAIASANP